LLAVWLALALEAAELVLVEVELFESWLALGVALLESCFPLEDEPLDDETLEDEPEDEPLDDEPLEDELLELCFALDEEDLLDLEDLPLAWRVAWYAALTEFGEDWSFQLDPVGTTYWLPRSLPENPRSLLLREPSEFTMLPKWLWIPRS